MPSEAEKMSPLLRPITECHNIDIAQFNSEIVPRFEPIVFRGLVKDWPIVNAATQSDDAMLAFFQALEPGGLINLVSAPASAGGCFFYNSDFTGFNFTRRRSSFAEFVTLIKNGAREPNADTVALQSAIVHEHFPGFIEQHEMPLFDRHIKPRVWIGNASTVVTHYDDSENIACAISGRRRFTLFPPHQISNLYVGPIEFTPAGAAVSLASIQKPDFERFPRLQEALKHALSAELHPGDAIYIPPLWWHHVESLEGINGLINYWRGGSIENNGKLGVPDAMLMALLTMSKLSPKEREAWSYVFDYFVFRTGPDPLIHIPPHIHGILGNLTPHQNSQLKLWLLAQLKK